MSSSESLAQRIGLQHVEKIVVEPRHTVPQVDSTWPGFADMPPVFATAMMVGFIEQTCVVALRDFLADGEGTVGTHVDVSHIAATPVGGEITAEIEFIAVEGRQLRFSVLCRDAGGIIGQGTHQRALIDKARFIAKVQERAANSTRAV